VATLLFNPSEKRCLSLGAVLEQFFDTTTHCHSPADGTGQLEADYCGVLCTAAHNESTSSFYIMLCRAVFRGLKPACIRRLWK